MPIHQLELAKRSKGATDEQKISALLAGRTSLREALAVDAGTLATYRRQAAALFDLKQYRACVDVVLGLVELDAAGLAEATMLARAYEALGETERAQAIDGVIANVVREHEDVLGAKEGAR